MIDKKESANKIYLNYIIASIVIYILGSLFIPLIEIDSVQYGNICREMLQNKSFLQIFDQGKDYLDKPPFLFWASSLSMYLFGMNDFAFRLPSMLMAVIAIYSTYKFTLLYYQKDIAVLSALVLATSQAMFLITHDVRMDTMLMSWVILGIWKFASWLQNKNWVSFIIAFSAIGFGMMTKGPIALMVPIFSFVPHLLIHKQYKLLFRWEYLVGLVIILILLLPMDIGLYQQFDLHPEKVMYGKTGTSGLRFFYWTQSFGRITGESTWHENDSIFFLFENLLWGFLPWTLFFIVGLVFELFNLFKNKLKIASNNEWITVPGFLITYLALGSSRYQLPHYIYIVLPFISIITAKCINNIVTSKGSDSKFSKILSTIHFIVFAFILVLLVYLLFVPFNSHKLLITILLLIAAAIFSLILYFNNNQVPKILHFALFAILTTNLFLNLFFYPKLLEYQLGNKVSKYINDKKISKSNFYLYQIIDSRSLNFYGNYNFKEIIDLNTSRKGDFILIENKNVPDSLLTKFSKIETIPSFHVSMLTGEFINPATRDSALNYFYILQKK
jgi:4-amino-4-deoxy-L-arabinose transferase-like glycosyltransferase